GRSVRPRRPRRRRAHDPVGLHEPGGALVVGAVARLRDRRRGPLRARRTREPAIRRRLASRPVADEAILLADVDRLINSVVASLGDPVADALAPTAQAGSRHRARLVIELAD